MTSVQSWADFMSVGPAVIQPAEIELNELIGEGAFGQVYRGTCRAQKVAVKVLKAQQLNDLQTFRDEVNLMSRIFHPNVCLFMGASLCNDHIRIVTELMKGDMESLLELDDVKERYPLSQRLKWAQDAARGLAWLHGNNPPIIHRDLKTANILYNDHNEMKVCDFGLSQLLPGGFCYEESPRGSPLYMAPEVMLGSQITAKVDVYSFGVILWEIEQCAKAFSHHCDYEEFKRCVAVQGERPQIPQST